MTKPLSNDEDTARQNALATTIKILSAAPNLLPVFGSGEHAGEAVVEFAERLRKYLNPETFTE